MTGFIPSPPLDSGVNKVETSKVSRSAIKLVWDSLGSFDVDRRLIIYSKCLYNCAPFTCGHIMLSCEDYGWPCSCSITSITWLCYFFALNKDTICYRGINELRSPFLIISSKILISMIRLELLNKFNNTSSFQNPSCIYNVQKCLIFRYCTKNNLNIIIRFVTRSVLSVKGRTCFTNERKFS